MIAVGIWSSEQYFGPDDLVDGVGYALNVTTSLVARSAAQLERRPLLCTASSFDLLVEELQQRLAPIEFLSFRASTSLAELRREDR